MTGPNEPLEPLARRAEAALSGGEIDPTVGMFDRPAWGFGANQIFAPGELVRVREPIPSIVVQSLGAPMPAFVTTRPFVDAAPAYELDLIYAAPWLSSTPSVYPTRLNHCAPQRRIVICDANLAKTLALPGALPKTLMLIGADAGGIATIGEALALVFSGQLLNCFSIADLMAIAGARADQTACGSAFALAAPTSAQSAKWARAALLSARNDGFSTGAMLVLLSNGDGCEVSPQVVDDFADEVFGEGLDTPSLITASTCASVSAAVAIAFGRTRNFQGPTPSACGSDDLKPVIQRRH